MSLDEFLNFLSLEDRAKKLDAAQAVLTSLDGLKQAMSTTDHPTWILPLENKLNWYRRYATSEPDGGLQLIKTILQLHPRIQSQKWDFADSDTIAAIDFSAIYQEYYRDSRVPELFDELVLHLQDIISSGEVDSLTTIKALERLIATIRKNARGDYFSTRGAWEFTQVFFKNFSLGLLEDTPGLKHIVKAVRKTMSELDLEMLQVHDNVKRRLTESMSDDLPMLEYKALALPAPKPDTDREVLQDRPNPTDQGR